MVDVTATIFKAMIQDSDISATNAEYLIDQAINRLNTYGCDLPNMTGTVSLKTVSVESRQAGAIYEVARLVYYGYYKGQDSVAVSGLTTTTPNMLNNPSVEAAIEKLAKQLIEMDVSTV